MKLKTFALMATILFIVAIPVSAQWMGGNGRHGDGCCGCMCRMMDVSTQPVDPATLPEPNSLGAQILKNQCTQCHGLVAPGQQAAQDWPTIVDRMNRRMQMMAQGHMGMMRRSIEPMTSAERQALIDYLQKHSFQAFDPEAMGKEQGTASETYISVCSRCHSLPDPAAHTPQEWSDVVDRMAKNMTNLGMPPLSPEIREEIVTYLQSEKK